MIFLIDLKFKITKDIGMLVRWSVCGALYYGIIFLIIGLSYSVTNNSYDTSDLV